MLTLLLKRVMTVGVASTSIAMSCSGQLVSLEAIHVAPRAFSLIEWPARAAPVRGSAGRRRRARSCGLARPHGASPGRNPRRAREKVTFIQLYTEWETGDRKYDVGGTSAKQAPGKRE
jgi:hypothetical protein